MALPKYQDIRVKATSWMIKGMLMSVLAGVVFVVFEMIASLILQGDVLQPLRMIGAILLTDDGLEPGYPLVNAISVAMVIHVLLSGFYGLVFGGIVLAFPALARNRVTIIATTTIFGLLLWLLNFYVIAPAAEFTWFANANPVVQFIAHAFFYGSSLGILLASRKYRAMEQDDERSKPAVQGRQKQAASR
jgi:hypothetical protein